MRNLSLSLLVSARWALCTMMFLVATMMDATIGESFRRRYLPEISSRTSSGIALSCSLQISGRSWKRYSPVIAVLRATTYSSTANWASGKRARALSRKNSRSCKSE